MAGFFKELSQSAAATAAATGTTAAASLIDKVFRGRNASELDGAADILADFLLESLQFALRREEITGDFIFKKRVAGTLKLADFRCTQLHAGVLLVVQFLAPLMDALVLKAGGVVVQETLDVRLKLKK